MGSVQLQEDLMLGLHWERESKVSGSTELHDSCVGFPGGGLLLSESWHVFPAHRKDQVPQDCIWNRCH